MFKSYQELTLMQLEILSKVPGFRRYGRFMLRKHQENFLRAWLVTNVVAFFVVLGIQILPEWLAERAAKRNAHTARGLHPNHLDQGDPDLLGAFLAARNFPPFTEDEEAEFQAFTNSEFGESMYASLHPETN